MDSRNFVFMFLLLHRGMADYLVYKVTLLRRGRRIREDLRR
jgi:hypothetical protein